MGKDFEKKEALRVCPSCGSTNIKWHMGGNLGDQYHCIDCNYVGVAILAGKKLMESLKRSFAKAAKKPEGKSKKVNR